MELSHPPQVVLGLDLGAVTTRASLFGLQSGKYGLLGQTEAPTSLAPGRHLGEGVADALAALQVQTERTLLNEDGSLIQPFSSTGEGLDQIVLASDAGPRLRTVVFGLSKAGSLRVGRAWAASLPLDLIGAFSIRDQVNQSNLLNRLIEIRPEVVLVTGGEDGGKGEIGLTWIEMLRTLCLVLPKAQRLEVIYAGNPDHHETLRRRLEPYTSVEIVPNVQPLIDRLDLAPAQAAADAIICRRWQEIFPGWRDLLRMAGGQASTLSFGLNRMMRFLGRPTAPSEHARGVAALDLGGGQTRLALGWQGQAAMTVESRQSQLLVGHNLEPDVDLHHWLAEGVDENTIQTYLWNCEKHPAVVPITAEEDAVAHALGHQHFRRASYHLAEFYSQAPWDALHGLMAHFEPIIVSGEVLTAAPHPGKTLLMALNGIQPRGVTTVVLDRFHLLPLLGALAPSLPVLPVHLLETDAFENLGTVIIPTSPIPAGERVLTVEVQKEGGTSFDVEIMQGTLKRVVIQVNEPAVLILKPERQTDVGFGGSGVGGRLKVTGGALGLVIDARGRPIVLPEDEEARIALIQRWQWTLGA